MNQDPTDVLGRRIGAALLDFVVLAVLFVILGLLIGDTDSDDGNVSVNLSGGPFLIWLALTLGYYGVLEAISGQTLGKRALGVRVVGEDRSSTPAAGKIAIRTLLRLIDGILFYLVGLIVVLVTGERRQRLGDLAAGTFVVRA